MKRNRELKEKLQKRKDEIQSLTHQKLLFQEQINNSVFVDRERIKYQMEDVR